MAGWLWAMFERSCEEAKKARRDGDAGKVEHYKRQAVTISELLGQIIVRSVSESNRVGQKLILF